jgi:hypothetical protein
MNNLKKGVLMLGFVVALPLCAGSEMAQVKNQAANATVPPKDTPLYKPPSRGAPAGRVGGATRGETERESFSLLVLAPDHAGFTTQQQPCLYWFISKPTTYSVELTVTERNAEKPLAEKAVKRPEKAGIQSACLADYDVRLSRNVHYKWFVTLVTDAEHRSKDILAGGVISLVDPQEALLVKLKEEDSSKAPSIYAEAGLWYDSLEAISKMIDASPANMNFRKQRASLLEQVGLVEVAEFESK